MPCFSISRRAFCFVESDMSIGVYKTSGYIYKSRLNATRCLWRSDGLGYPGNDSVARLPEFALERLPPGPNCANQPAPRHEMAARSARIPVLARQRQAYVAADLIALIRPAI
jgi:hypothetical protein